LLLLVEPSWGLKKWAVVGVCYSSIAAVFQTSC
jgi:hypothetical protein